jgi:hypothetical protein
MTNNAAETAMLRNPPTSDLLAKEWLLFWKTP